jgi:hypothetical protein
MGTSIRFFRRRCSGCEPCRHCAAVPLRRTCSPVVCSEAQNNTITAFFIYGAYDPEYDLWGSPFVFEGIRRLYAAACARMALSSRPKPAACGCSDLRGNKLRDFRLNDFLSLALQLEELCAAAHAHARCRRRAIGGA